MSDLPPGWEWTTLDELRAPEERAITDGPFGSNLTSAHYTQSGARVVRLQNVGDGVFIDERAYISLEHYEKLRKYEVREGDLVVASLGENPPRACLVPNLGVPAIVKADCIRVRLHNEVDSRWVLYALSAPAIKDYAADKLRGVGRPRLGLTQIRNIPIPLPPLAEQRRLVSALEGLLARIDAGIRLLRTSERQAATLLKRVIIDAVPIPSPSHWRMATVREVGEVDLGRQRHPDWHHGPHMKSYLRVANVFEDRIDSTDVMEMDFPPEVFERYRLRGGDILLNEGQSPELLGRPAMYRGDPPDVAFTNSLIRFRAKPEVDPEWALLVFRRHMHAGRFLREVRITTNIAHLSAGRFKAVEFPIPPMDEQKQIVYETRERLGGVAKLATSIELLRRKARVLREGVLARAFAGLLVEQDPRDEPAAATLARIRAARAATLPTRGKASISRPRRATTRAGRPTTTTEQQGELPL